MNKESQQRATLRDLEKEGKWVFHGSPTKTDILQPRQAYNYPNNSDEGKIPDDKPAVFASQFIDIAIFMAVINKVNAPKGTRSAFQGDDDGNLHFQVTKETMDQIHDATGYVYVFDKSKFISRSPIQCLSYEAVKPVEMIMITEKDLPANIEIKEF